MPEEEIVAGLARRSLAVAGAEPVIYQRWMAIRRPEVVRFSRQGLTIRG
jgi:hypothetical protein